MRLAVATRKGILLLTTLAVLVAGQVVPASQPAAAAESSRAFSPFGMAGHPMWGDRSNSDIDRELDAMATAGARWIRFDIGWLNFESARGQYESYFFNKLDYIVGAARRRGIEPQVAVFGTPKWANGGAGMYVPPTSDADFANFMAKMASTYQGRIKYWEIWNEPNLKDFWQPQPDAARYVRLLKAAYVAIKRANPDALVISAGLSNCQKEYLEQMYAAGVRGYFDLLGLHPYTANRSPYYEYHDYDARWNFAGILDMRAVMEANGDADKHIWISETGWQTSTAGDWPVTEEQQARYLTETYERVLNEFPYVDAVMIYDVRDDGTNPASPEDNFGLLHRDFTPKPAYNAFARAATSWSPSLSISAAATTITYGQSTTLTVKVAPAGTTPITLQQMVASVGQWEDVTTTATNEQGVLQMSVAPTATTSYRAAAPDRGQTSPTITVGVKATVTIRPSRRRVRHLRVVRISGKIVPAANSRVILQRKRGTRWVNVRFAITDAAGRYFIRMKLFRRGRFYYRARFKGNASHLGTHSRSTPLRVY